MNAPLEHRFLRHLQHLDLRPPNTHLLVAVSGGCDSMVLLHLLRFHAPDLRVTAAHFDHAMRPGSDADARWVAGVCRAWAVSLVSDCAAPGLQGETDARRARYHFLRSAARSAGATHVATAHHADDQAETVLFRILRGTGIAGLAGIAASHPSGLVRPLLPFWRREIGSYARRSSLRWRDDPTNRLLTPARNRIRHEILPLLERTIAPGARRNLVQLGLAARETERAWEAVLAPVLQSLIRREGEDVLIDRDEFQVQDPAVRSRILRSILREFAVVLDRTGTRTAIQFISESPSGRQLQLPGGVRITTEWGSARISRVRRPPEDEPLTIGAPSIPGEQGCGVARIGGQRYRVTWRVTEPAGVASDMQPSARLDVELRLANLAFPLLLRGWEPGDRIRTAGGTKKLKKLFLERRVPRSRRGTTPVLVDRDGVVVWVAGVQKARSFAPRPGDATLVLAITDD